MLTPFCLAPMERLKPYVAHYQVFETMDFPLGWKQIFRLPGGSICMAFCYGDQPSFFTDRINSFQLPDEMVLGIFTRTYRLLWNDNRILIITFKPFGIYHIFGIHPYRVTNQILPLNRLGIYNGHYLSRHLREMPDTAEKIYLIERWLLQKLDKHNDPVPGLLENIFRQIVQTNGLVPVTQMISQARLNPRYVERQFHDYIGISPKTCCEIIRFNYLINSLTGDRPATFSKLVDIGKFHDHSHMIKHFSKFCGTTPGHLLQEFAEAPGFQRRVLQQYNLLNICSDESRK